jgi:hypothetical protein
VVPEGSGLHGFVHAGGVLQDAVLANMTLGRYRAVFAPKVPGLYHMQTSMQVAPMRAVVLFSSIAAFLGSGGQSNYTGANAALDAAAAVRQSHGLVSSSVQWGTWAGSGMALRDASTMRRAERAGIGVVMPDVGLAVTAVCMQASVEGTSGVEMLQVGLASAFVWPTFLTQVSDPGVFSAFEMPSSLPHEHPIKRKLHKHTKATAQAAGSSSSQKQALRSQVMSIVGTVLYNPALSDHQDILWKAAMIEIDKEKKEKKLDRSLTGMFPTKDQAPTQQSYMAEMSVGLPGLDDETEENEKEVVESEDENGDMVPKKSTTKPKTRKQRRDQKIREHEEFLKKKENEKEVVESDSQLLWRTGCIY